MENEATQTGESNAAEESRNATLKAAVEAIVYVAEEPVTVAQITAALAAAKKEAGEEFSSEAIQKDVDSALALLLEEYRRGDRGLEIREIAGGYKMFTKPEHHDTIRRFVKNLTPPFKLSMAALETLATIAYRQPITVPEIQQIRGVQATSTLNTLLDRKLITTAGRKDVIGRPILYKTTKEFLVKFGLGSLTELPTLEEFSELARAALGEDAGGLTADPSLETSSTPEPLHSGPSDAIDPGSAGASGEGEPNGA
jgi:segregation and condensation protein B